MNLIGYACVNLNLYRPKLFNNSFEPIFTHRSCVKKTFQTKGIDYVSGLALKNCLDLKKIILWNIEHDFKFFRISSDMFPWNSYYNLKDLKDYNAIVNILNEIGKIISENSMRITSHPGPFNILSSTKESVIENTLKDLSLHGEVFDLLGLSSTCYNKINIHVGATYGNKQKSLETFCDNFKRLPLNVRKRLTVENDDRKSMYSTLDLYNGVYKEIGVPIVFDFHHHKFCNGGLTEKEALELALKTWPKDIIPVVHYSESRSIEKNDSSIKPHAHSDFVYERIKDYGHIFDVMIEAKQKELSVIKYNELHR